MEKNIKVAYRFPDLETAYGFITESKTKYDEVILLMDQITEVEEPEEAQKVEELPKQEVNKEKLIKDLMAENERLKAPKGDLEAPKRDLEPPKKSLLSKFNRSKEPEKAYKVVEM